MFYYCVVPNVSERQEKQEQCLHPTHTVQRSTQSIKKVKRFKRVCYISHFKLLLSPPHRLITHSAVILSIFCMKLLLFCHNSYVLIICIYLLHVNELRVSVICFDNCKLKSKVFSLFV